jgi:hypothetical protein
MRVMGGACSLGSLQLLQSRHDRTELRLGHNCAQIGAAEALGACRELRAVNLPLHAHLHACVSVMGAAAATTHAHAPGTCEANERRNGRALCRKDSRMAARSAASGRPQ